MVGIDVRAAAALIARMLRKSTNKGYFLILPKRQRALVFEQHHRFQRRLMCLFMIRSPVKHGRFIPIFRIAEHNL